MRPVTNRDSAAAQHDAPPYVQGPRRAYLDVLKVVVIVGVIVAHAWAGYTQIGGWVYSDFREVSLGPATLTIAEALLGPFGLFAMGLLFLVSGLLSIASLRRKGPRRFAYDRLRRLGAPLLVFTFVLWPPVRAGLNHLTKRPTSPWWVPDPAHLWFVQVLLIFSVGAAVWWRWTSADSSGGAVASAPVTSAPVNGAPLTAGLLVMLGIVVAVASFVIRLWYPLGSTGPVALHLCQWPQFLALFGLGLAAARRGWLDPVSAHLRRRCGQAAVFGVAAIGVLALIAAASGVSPNDFLGGPHWASLVTCSAEGLLTVTVPIWLLGVAQRYLDGVQGAEPAARIAFAAFLIQGHVLIGLAVAVRALALPAALKASFVAGAGLALCFAIGALLVKKTPLRRVL